jgi:transposase
LREGFTGHFDEHHRFLLAKMLARVDGIDTDIAALDAQIETHLAPFAPDAVRLDEIQASGRSRPWSSLPRSAWT